MRAIIAGPRSRITADDPNMGWMHIELELEELPKRGDVIILNSGNSYYVTNIMWWVDGPENAAYWARGDYRTSEGRYQTVRINVEPDNRRDRYGYQAGLEDGQKRGGEEFLAELRDLLTLSDSAGVGVQIISTWLARKETALAERQAAEAAQEARATEILARLHLEKDSQ